MATRRSNPSRSSRREQGSCGGTPRRDGSGGGRGNRSTTKQPKK